MLQTFGISARNSARVFGFVQWSASVLARDGSKVFQEFGQRMPAVEVIDQRLEGTRVRANMTRAIPA
jgi:hypothetical protein